MAKADLLLSEDFQEFVKAMVQEGHVATRMLLDGNVTPEYFKGAMEMFRRMVKSPLRYADAGNEEQQTMAGLIVKKAFSEFEAKLMRGYSIDKDE